MKKIPCLVALFCYCLSPLYAQTKPVEIRKHNLLDTIFYLNGKDTVYVETYYPNSHKKSKSWKKDSFYLYYPDGSLKVKEFQHEKYDFGYNFKDINSNIADFEKWEFYPNGSVMEHHYWTSPNHYYSEDYKPNGEVVYSQNFYKINPTKDIVHQFYYTQSSNKIKRKAMFSDTLKNTVIDSSFNEKGVLQNIEYSVKIGKETNIEKIIYYDETGKQYYSWQLDSNRLHIDKDNGDCLFGFRNMKGDWVIPPHYDKVQNFNVRYFIVNKNEKYGIIDDFGKPILPLDYDFLNDPNSRDFEPNNTSMFPPSDAHPLRYRMGDKYGILDFKGQVILPPQYDDVRGIFREPYEVKVGNKWGLIDKKGTFLVQPQFDAVNENDLDDVYEVYNINENAYYKEVKGLINNKGVLLLNLKFSEIENDIEQKEILKVTTYSEGEINANRYDGVFHTQKGWILDTVYQIDYNTGICKYFKRHPTIHDSIISIRQGLINEKYEILIPFEFDYIRHLEKISFTPEKCDGLKLSSCAEIQDIYLCSKDKKYGIFDKVAKKWLVPLTYDFIYPFEISFKESEYGEPYKNDWRFIALSKNKWQWIDENGQPLSNITYDYAGSFSNRFDFIGILDAKDLFTIRSNTLEIWDNKYFPIPVPIETLGSYMSYGNSFDEDSNVKLAQIIDFDKGDLLINKKGGLVVPPQYNIVSWHDEYALAKDTSGKQYLFDINGKMRPFLGNYKVHLAQINKGVVIVEDEKTHKMGLVNPDGKILIPCVHHIISAVDTGNTVWVQTTVPKEPVNKSDINFPSYSSRNQDLYLDSVLLLNQNYALLPQDSGWHLYNTQGKLVTKTVFAFPFNISEGFGAGVIRAESPSQNPMMGVWKADGTNIIPPQYNHLFFDDFNRLFYLYQKDKNGKMLVGFADTTGKIILKPSVERLGIFNGDYAIAQTEQGLGIMMKNGQYKILPQPHSFRKSSENIDSLLMAFTLAQKEKDKDFYIPYGYFTPKMRNRYYNDEDKMDTLKSTIIDNLLVEKTAEGDFIDGKFVPFYRSDIARYQSEVHDKDININRESYYSPTYGLTSTVYNLSDIHKSPHSVGFVLGDDENRMPRSCGNRSYNYTFFNFMPVPQSNDWREVTIDDFLTTNPTNSFKINQLIIGKIRDLKDSKIDCTNTEGYFEEVKQKFYVFPEGLRFFFAQKWYFNIKSTPSVFFTWEELKPFLKN